MQLNKPWVKAAVLAIYLVYLVRPFSTLFIYLLRGHCQSSQLLSLNCWI